MLSGPAAFPTIGRYLVDAVTSRLRNAGLTVPDRASVVPAPIVADECECGLLAVAVARVVGSLDGRTEAAGIPVTSTGQPIPTEAMPWPPYLLGELQVAVLRCATTDGVPTAQQLADEADEVHADSYWTTVAVVCELDRLRRAKEIEDYLFGDEPFLPAQGGCQGAQVNVSVGVPFLCPCP